MKSMILTKMTVLMSVLMVCLGCDNKSISQDQTAATSIGIVADHLDPSVRKVFQDSQDNYWFMGDSGVYKTKDSLIVWLRAEDGLHSNHIRYIQEDKQGDLYFESDEGVTKYDGKTFQQLWIKEGFETDWKLGDNDMWFQIGFSNKGPYRYDGDTLYRLEFPSTSTEVKFFELYPNAGYSPYGLYYHFTDSKNNVWFGTTSMGAARFDGNSVGWMYEDYLTHTPEGGDFGIRSIFEDSHGDFWICNTRERFHVSGQSADASSEVKIEYTKSPGVGFKTDTGEMYYPYFFSMVEDKAGDLWMASYDEGVYRKSGDELIHYPLKEGDETVLTFLFYKDNSGGIWLTTHNFGLYKYDGQNFVRFSM
jgi:ligand-binding sensor domain-containing protein